MLALILAAGTVTVLDPAARRRGDRVADDRSPSQLTRFATGDSQIIANQR
jgi:hypothetical protein